MGEKVKERNMGRNNIKCHLKSHIDTSYYRRFPKCTYIYIYMYKYIYVGYNYFIIDNKYINMNLIYKLNYIIYIHAYVKGI